VHTVAALGPSRAGITALRRTLPRPGPHLSACRSPAALDRALGQHIVEAVVVAPPAATAALLARLRTAYPAIPLIAYAPLRADDADLVLAWYRAEVEGVLVEGVDDPAAADLVLRRAVSRRVAAALKDAPRRFGLSEPLQHRAWQQVLAAPGGLIEVGHMARALGLSREHLSRQFAAGGAPPLKRAIDLVRVAWAAQLLGNPGYTPAAVARILRFSSASHLGTVARRITGMAPAGLRGLGPAGVLTAFLRRQWTGQGSPVAGTRLL